MVKILKKAVKLFFTVALSVVIVLLLDMKSYAGEEIYFDDEGNLIYITYDKKATSSVSYKAIGWILKRYDAPIDAKGQQYVIVRKIEYAVDDPDNPGYLYCYFWSDKDEILNAVDKVSAEWRAQLEKYGDMVYIDNVMTICNSKVPLGNVSYDGTCTGEVYYTFDGISKARPWAHPEYLKSYFDIELRFPILTEVPEIKVTESYETKSILKSGNINSMAIGSNEPGLEEYDLNQGMPSGEKIFFMGSCDSYCYELDYSTWSHIVYIPVKVNTKYTIKWVDIEGRSVSETRIISRWYSVPKAISYNAINSFKIYDLDKVSVASELLCSEEVIYKSDGESKVAVGNKVYGDYINHLERCQYVCSTANVLLSSTDYKKPAIPEEDYWDVAKKAVNNVLVRSDYLAVDGMNILSDNYKSSAGASVKKVSQSSVDIYKGGVKTQANVKNGIYDDFIMNCSYIERTNGENLGIQNTDINSVNVHTPVVCKGNIRGDKTVNQAENPSSTDIVLDGDFYLSFNFFGKHNDIKGYGLRDYSKYVKEMYVKFPFQVRYKSSIINANQWIRLDDVVSEFHLLKDIDVGTYMVDYKVIAVNGDKDSSIGNGYNTSINEYGACFSSVVNVIGRIYDMEVSCEGTFAVGDKDYNGEKKTAAVEGLLPKEFDVCEEGLGDISVTTLGSLGKDAYLQADIRYLYINEKIEDFIQVDIYSEQEYCDNYLLDTSFADAIGDETYKWSFAYELPENFVVISKETKEILSGGMVFIVFDFKLINEGAKTISYLNEDNYLRGYCSMWRQQGGVEEITTSAGSVTVKEGTTFYAFLGNTTKYDYEVNGTH